MAPISTKRRHVEDEFAPKKKSRKIKKQKIYHSSSEEESDGGEAEGPRPRRASDAPQAKRVPRVRAEAVKPAPLPKSKPGFPKKSILKQSKAAALVRESEADEESGADGADTATLEKNTALNALKHGQLSDDDQEDKDNEPDINLNSDADSENDTEEDDVVSDSEASMTSSQAQRSKKKRNDPSAFATSISKILDTKLSTAKRQDPVLSRSKSAAEANKQLADLKLEQKARAQIRAEKKQTSEKGRVKDLLGLDTPDVDTGALMEEEKRLKKTAQRGVVKLFNAVRAAQVKAEEAVKQARSEGVVGMQKREENAREMSKAGFLSLISSGGKQNAAAT